jgi:hypothetical protein
MGYLAAGALLILAIRVFFEADHHAAHRHPSPPPH